MKRIAGASLIPAGVLALAACGGGGNGGVVIEDFTVPVVNEESALALTGGDPLEISRHVVQREQVAIIDGADTNFFWIKGINEDGVVDQHGGGRSDCFPICDSSVFRDHGEDTARFTPIMTKNGIPLARSWYLYVWGHGGTEETFGYGGWMDHSLFAVQLWAGENHYEGEYWFAGGGVISGAMGHASGSNPGEGILEWNGVMVGRNSDIESSLVTNVIQGDAGLSAEFSQAGDVTIDVTFSNIKDLNAGRSMADMTWNDVPVVNGSFEISSIAGGFFGPQHEEIAGVFERNQVIGAFGGRR